jgi:rhamnose utilization protein RhaD (predicted bifunctional aldolase and dehydrogenase)/NAD(P)-dependent dehydrogenase (short-subunit alcohol dehydrogenase family)
MENLWSDEAAQQYIDKYAEAGEDIALRVYTSQLIGANSKLVMHGGGNTSVKTIVRNQFGEDVEVIAVKGSGWNLDTIEPAGLPCVDLAHCRKLRTLDALSDADMVNELRTHMLDYTAPNPSVETLLHAFLPHKFIDHSHADAILSIVDQEDAANICKEVFGEEWGIVEYIMPGFDLSKRASEVYEANPNVKGLLLLKHGLFTFASTAKESYDNHIAAVTLAEEYLASKPRPKLTVQNASYTPQAAIADVFPALRAAFHKRTGQHWVLHHRVSDAALQFANSEEAKQWSQRGTLTPDHVIRTKQLPLLLNALPVGDKESVGQAVETAIESYTEAYDAYFARQHARVSETKTQLDPLPRVVLLEGVGLVTVARNMKAARIAADIYEHTIDAILDAMAIGNYQPVSEADTFDMEYWSLEQAKLGRAKPKVLEGKVAYVTGAASGIGLACAETFARAGAAVYMVDLQGDNLKQAIDGLHAKGLAASGQTVDVTSEASVAASFGKALQQFGGIDIVVSNAGSAFQGPIAELPLETLEASMNLNFYSHQYVASHATRIMKAQNSGGCLLFNVSKAALNPGAQFGPYAIAKAAAMALMKQYALEYGGDGIRANAINADRVRTGLFTDSFVKERAAARGLEPEAYFRSNLLKREVTSNDVADAFLQLALAEKTTAAILTVDGGNIAASPR